MIRQSDDSNQSIVKVASKSLEGKESTSTTDSETKKPKSMKKKTKNMDMDTTPTSAMDTDTDDTERTTRSVASLNAASKGNQNVSKTAGGRGSGSSTVGRGKGRGGRGRGRGRGGRGAPASRGGTIIRNSSMPSNASVPAHGKRPQSMVNFSDSQSAPAPVRPKSIKKMNGRGAGVSNGAGRGSAPKRKPGVRPPARASSMSTTSASGDSLDPPPPSRRDSSPPKLPQSGSTAASSNPTRAPSKPQSILRNSSHGTSSGSGHGESLHGGSSHRGSSHERKSTQSRTNPSITRVNPDGSVTVSTMASSSAHPQAIPEDADLLDDMDPNFADQNPTTSMHPTVNMTPDMRDSYHTRSEASVRSPKSKSMDESGHSQTSRSIQQFSLSKYQSTRSIMTVDREPEFEDDNHVQKVLRYIRILPPHRDEKPIKRNIRIMTWVSLFCDMLAAFVSIGTYDGTAHCCDIPILNIAGEFQWDLTIRIITYVYVLLIFVEIIPVLVLDGIPFNLLNPFLGFLITFAVFFDDRILEAVVMWIIEATAVALEVACYRLKLRQHNDRDERMKECETELKPFSEARRARRKTKQSTRDSSMFDKTSDDDSSESGDSFGNDSFQDEDVEEPQDLSQVRELKLLRERRVLRHTQKEHAQTLHYHMIGVAVNVSLVVIAFLLIVCIGRSGGLCILNMEAPSLFATGQIEKCYDCKGIEGVCEICNLDDGLSQCYYPYY